MTLKSQWSGVETDFYICTVGSLVCTTFNGYSTHTLVVSHRCCVLVSCVHALEHNSTIAGHDHITHGKPAL